MHWEFANEQEAEEPIATKWLKKIAQRFNPRYSDTLVARGSLLAL